jgi:hypothetical protein
MIPTLEIEIPGQSPQVIEESLAGGQVRTQEFVLLIEQFQQRVEQQRQDVEGGEERSEMLLAVPKIVF